MPPPDTTDPFHQRVPGAVGTGAIRRRRFIQGVGAATAATALVGGWSGETHAAVAAGASQFVPLAEVTRVLDTRTADHPYTRFDPTWVRVALAGQHGVPNDAVAIVATVTAINPSGVNGSGSAIATSAKHGTASGIGNGSTDATVPVSSPDIA